MNFITFYFINHTVGAEGYSWEQFPSGLGGNFGKLGES